MRLLALAKEKRFIQMQQFQVAADGMITIAQQSLEFSRGLVVKWFQSELDDVEQSVLPNPLRQADPKRAKVTTDAWRTLVLDEDGITAKAKTVARFIANRGKTRGVLAT